MVPARTRERYRRQVITTIAQTQRTAIVATPVM
jgi:hypothetical protein